MINEQLIEMICQGLKGSSAWRFPCLPHDLFSGVKPTGRPRSLETTPDSRYITCIRVSPGSWKHSQVLYLVRNS